VAPLPGIWYCIVILSENSTILPDFQCSEVFLMPIGNLANMSAPVLSATLLLNPPASQYRPERFPVSRRHPGRRRSARTWRSWVKATARPFIPPRYRSRVRLVLVASIPAAQARPAAAARRDDTSRRAA
jgi:hypothetical protein